jgi:hypothetical protein
MESRWQVSLSEKMDQISELMKQTKESWVASEPENTDLAIYLHFWRDEELVAMVQCPLERDIGLQAGLIGAAGFAASTMSLTFESYTSQLPKSPNTGEAWKPQEMQYTFEAVPENREKKWVLECLTTSAHERGGEFGLASLPYEIENHQVIWGEDQLSVHSTIDGEGAGGVMFDWLQDAMSRPTIEQVMAENAQSNKITAAISKLVDDPEVRLFHTDMATYTAMKEKGLITAVMFTAAPGSVREQMIRDRLGEEAVTEPWEEIDAELASDT